MDPELLAQLFGYLNPVGSAQAQMLGPTITPPHPGASMVSPQGLDLPPQSSPVTRASEYGVPGPRMDLAAQLYPPPPPTVVAATAPPLPAPGAPADVPGVPTPSNPMQMRPPEPYMSEPMGASTLGAALEPTGSKAQVNPWSAGGSLGSGPASASGISAASASDNILKSLRGVQMPAAPTPQKVSTPHAPNPVKMQGGQLMDLLASLGIGPQQALPGLKLPSTLGQALGGR